MDKAFSVHTISYDGLLMLDEPPLFSGNVFAHAWEHYKETPHTDVCFVSSEYGPLDFKWTSPHLEPLLIKYLNEYGKTDVA